MQSYPWLFLEENIAIEIVRRRMSSFVWHMQRLIDLFIGRWISEIDVSKHFWLDNTQPHWVLMINTSTTVSVTTRSKAPKRSRFVDTSTCRRINSRWKQIYQEYAAYEAALNSTRLKDLYLFPIISQQHVWASNNPTQPQSPSWSQQQSKDS